MRKIFIFLVLGLSACASKTPRNPAATLEVPPSDAFKLEEALQQGSIPTVAYLKTKVTAKSFEGLDAADPATVLPKGVRAERGTPASREKGQQRAFIQKYRVLPLAKKVTRAQQLVSDFDCSKASETQALGFAMEVDFPEDEALTQAQALHEKVLVCEAFQRQDSLFKLTVFSIHKKECPKAMAYLDKFPPTPERGVNDRIAYLRSLCSSDKQVDLRNPWGGYGSLLEDKDTDRETPTWFLSATSGDENWDRFLASLIELHEKGEPDSIRYLATKINYDKLRTLPLSFQTSVMVMLSFNAADLAVFQTLHRYLSEHPEMLSPAVAGLLFPTRFWREITENSRNADPVLVKALIRQESAFNPQARSRARAIGLMQLIYPTARSFGITNSKQLLVPEENIHAGSEFLSRLIGEFGSVELALAAYNAGPAVVHQWQKRYPTENIDLFVEMIPYSETREYVRLVKRNYKIYQSILNKPQVVGDIGNLP